MLKYSILYSWIYWCDTLCHIFSCYEKITNAFFVPAHTHLRHLNEALQMSTTTFWPRRDKTCLWGFQQSEIQISLLSHQGELEKWNFACSKLRYGTFQNANNKGADQTLVCACVVRKPSKTGFLALRPIYFHTKMRVILYFFNEKKISRM